MSGLIPFLVAIVAIPLTRVIVTIARVGAPTGIVNHGSLVSMDARELLAEALRLSDEERAALAGELIQSLDPEVDADVEAAWSVEIRSRLDRVDTDTDKTIPRSEARRRIRAAARFGPRE